MKDFLRQNGILLLIAAVLLSVVVWLGSALLGGTDPMTNLANTVSTPFRSGINGVSAFGLINGGGFGTAVLFASLAASYIGGGYSAGNAAAAFSGGIGTTLFYVLGGILVVGAVVVMITRKRMSN